VRLSVVRAFVAKKEDWQKNSNNTKAHNKERKFMSYLG
jgi:hypothetical protein